VNPPPGGDWLPVAAGIVFVVGAAAAALKFFSRGGLSGGAGARRVYAPRGILFTDAELVFLSSLDIAVKGRCRVFGKVRVADVIDVSQSAPDAHRQSAFSSIAQKHVDFVLTDLSGRRILAAIELDDSSHARGDRSARDVLLNNAFQDAGVPLIRFPVRRGYSPKILAERIGAALTRHV